MRLQRTGMAMGYPQAEIFGSRAELSEGKHCSIRHRTKLCCGQDCISAYRLAVPVAGNGEPAGSSSTQRALLIIPKLSMALSLHRYGPPCFPGLKNSIYREPHEKTCVYRIPRNKKQTVKAGESFSELEPSQPSKKSKRFCNRPPARFCGSHS